MAFSFKSDLDYDNVTDYSENVTTISSNVLDSSALWRFWIVLEHTAQSMNVNYTPLLIVLGCIGNIISIMVFFKSKLRLQSTSQYLSALATSDTVFLLQLLPPWLNAMGFSKIFTHQIFCQLNVYLSYVTSNVSSWFVVAFSIERFVAVVYPLRRNSMCTVQRARYIIGALTAIALLVNLPVLRFTATNGTDCNIDEHLVAHASHFNMYDTITSFTLPLTLIVIINAWITIRVCGGGRSRDNMIHQQRGRAQLSRPSPSQRSQLRVTRMLLIVSSIYVVLNLPAYTMRTIAYAKSMNQNEYVGKWAALQQICLILFHTNFGINFLLYCWIGQNFRRALRETFSCLVPRPRPDRRDLDVEGGTHASNIPMRRVAEGANYGVSFADRRRQRRNDDQVGVNMAGAQETTGRRRLNRDEEELGVHMTGAREAGEAASRLRQRRNADEVVVDMAGARGAAGRRRLSRDEVQVHMTSARGEAAGRLRQRRGDEVVVNMAGARGAAGRRRLSIDEDEVEVHMTSAREAAGRLRQRRADDDVYPQRWIFNNSRQRARESFEMQPMSGGNI